MNEPREHNGEHDSAAAAEPLVMALSADENYAMPLAVTLYSALTNLEAGRDVRVYILDSGIAPESKRRLRRVADLEHVAVRLEWIAPDAARIGDLDLEMLERFTESIFLRLLIPEIVPGHFDRALYLDSDMIVEADLARLWQREMNGHAVLAARDYAIPYMSSELGVARWKELGYASDDPYFNSGLMMMNLRRWRSERISEKVLAYLSENRGRLTIPGVQEGLNAVLGREWDALDMRWNLIDCIYDDARYEWSRLSKALDGRRAALARSPYIIHFTAQPKPWHPNCTHPKRPRFCHYLRASEWFSRVEYARWRLDLARQNLWQQAKDRSRPYRHAARRTLRNTGAMFTPST